MNEQKPHEYRCPCLWCENKRLRAELAEARKLLNEAANKLGREHEGLAGKIAEILEGSKITAP